MVRGFQPMKYQTAKVTCNVFDTTIPGGAAKRKETRILLFADAASEIIFLVFWSFLRTCCHLLLLLVDERVANFTAASTAPC